MFVKEDISKSNDVVISSSRHIAILKNVKKSIEEAHEGALKGDYLDMVEITLKEAYNSLGEIIGKGSPDELLDELFNKFCLGK